MDTTFVTLLVAISAALHCMFLMPTLAHGAPYAHEPARFGKRKRTGAENLRARNSFPSRVILWSKDVGGSGCIHGCATLIEAVDIGSTPQCTAIEEQRAVVGASPVAFIFEDAKQLGEHVVLPASRVTYAGNIGIFARCQDTIGTRLSLLTD